MSLKKLTEVSVEEHKKFLESFKYVFCDMDGVIWMLFKPLPGAVECCQHLEQIGKKLVYITNNNLTSEKTIYSELAKNNFPKDKVIAPGAVIIDYLKSINFNKSVYAISSTVFQEELKEAGFSVIKGPPKYVNNDYEFLDSIKDNKDVGAVIFDGDINLTRIKLQTAVTYLRRPDCIFIAGACDEAMKIGDVLIGNGHFYRCLSDFTKRHALVLAKPSKDYAKFVMNKLAIENEKDVLFIGDSIDSDMKFAANAGFRKLLVLSGVTSLDDVKNWTYSEEFKPDYYVDSLDELNNIIKSVYNENKL